MKLQGYLQGMFIDKDGNLTDKFHAYNVRNDL